jgi:single-strand DNA-binding protein
MASFNKVILIGNLCADPELKTTPNGVSVTSFSLAVGRRKVKDQEPQTDFINIVAWRNTAEFICNYFQKGKAILIVGTLQTRTWNDQNGQKRYVTEVVAEEAQFVEKKSDSTSPVEASRMPSNSTPSVPYQAPTQTVNSSNSPYSSQATVFEEMTGDDDLPF